jgi:hypothetical protein
MIAQMAARLNAQRTLETALNRILRDSADFLGAKFGTVWLLGDRGQLILVAQRGFDNQFVQSHGSLALATGHPASRAATGKRPVSVLNLDEEKQFAPFYQSARVAGFISLHATPLAAHPGACIGVMVAYFNQPHRPTTLEQNMLETYGKIAADRILALLGSEPISIRAPKLYEKILKETEAKERNAAGRGIYASGHMQHDQNLDGSLIVSWPKRSCTKWLRRRTIDHQSQVDRIIRKLY